MPVLSVYIDELQIEETAMSGNYCTGLLKFDAYISNQYSEDELDNIAENIIQQVERSNLDKKCDTINLAGIEYNNDEQEGIWRSISVQYQISFFREEDC